MTPDVLVTGSAGRVGRDVMAALEGRAIGYDLPHDVLDEKQLATALRDVSQVVHLAWNTTTENLRTGARDRDNVRMVGTLMDVAVAQGVRRVVLASSVHAGAVRRSAWRRVRPTDDPRPATPYGESKVEVERLGEAAAALGLDVVALRLGGLRASSRAVHREPGLWLGEGDLRSLVQAVVDAPVVPGRSVVVYGVSRNLRRQHSTANPFGWRPQQRSVT